MKKATIALLALAALVWSLSGCSSTPTAKGGDTVKVNYTGKLDDGSVFDSSQGREPLQFVLGAGQMIAGFDQGVVGMKVGEKKTIILTPEQAYGLPSDERIMRVGKGQFPADLELTVGMQLQGPTGFPVTVKEIGADSVTIDTNHPLAGKTLTFEVEMMEITPPADSSGQ